MSSQQEIATPINRVAKKRTPTQTVTYIATLCAFCIVLKWLSNVLSVAVPLSLKISLAYIGWFVSAIVVGPLLGGCVAGISDVLGQLMLATGGAPNPILICGNFCATMAFGLVYLYLPTGKLPQFVASIIKVIVGAIACVLVGTLGLNTLGLWIYYYSDTQYFAFWITRLVQLVMAGVNTAIVILIVPVIKRLKLETDAFLPIEIGKKHDKQYDNETVENQINETENE